MKHISEVIQSFLNQTPEQERQSVLNRIQMFRRLHIKQPDNPWFVYEMRLQERLLAELDKEQGA